MSKYEATSDGEWFPLPEKVACCSCGLVHMVKASKRKGRIGVRFYRLPRETGGIRKGMGVKVVRAKRTTFRTSKGAKLYAVRDKSGKWKDIQTYKRAHSAPLRVKSD